MFDMVNKTREKRIETAQIKQEEGYIERGKKRKRIKTRWESVK